MTDDEAAQLMTQISQKRDICDHIDTEQNHEEADKLLCTLLKDLGYVKTVEAFERMEKWYS